MIARDTKILVLAPNPHLPGPIPTITALLVEAMVSLGLEARILVWGGHSANDGNIRKVLDRTRDLMRVRRALDERPADTLLVMTAHDWPALLRDVPLLLLTRRQALTRVVQFHGSNVQLLSWFKHPLMRLATNIIARQCDAVFVLSGEEARQWLAVYPSTPAFVVRNAFVPPRSSATRHVGLGAPVVLFVGRVIREKGVFTLLKATAVLRQRRDVRLRVVGDGRDWHLLRSAVSALGLDDAVRLDGRLEGDDLTQAYLQASVFALPTAWPEGFPTVLAEAMWAGLPIVTTRVRGAADVLRSGENAVFVRSGDPLGLATAIERVLSDARLAERMSEANRKLVTEFAPEQVAERYLAALSEVRLRARPLARGGR